MSDKCTYCNGRGIIGAYNPPNTPMQLMVIGSHTCDHCGGTGKVKELDLKKVAEEYAAMTANDTMPEIIYAGTSRDLDGNDLGGYWQAEPEGEPKYLSESHHKKLLADQAEAILSAAKESVRFTMQMEEDLAKLINQVMGSE